MKGRFSILLLSGALIIGVFLFSEATFAKDVYSTNKKATKEMISATISDVREKCKATDEEIMKEGLTEQDVQKVRDFCALSNKEMGKILKERIESSDSKKTKSGNDGDVGTLSYGCWYYGYNKSVPSYGDLGLSSASCSWHDYDKPYACKVERGVACLWGCTNSDPKLGWHETTFFASQSDLDSYLYRAGYHRTSGYAVGRFWQELSNADYTRAIDYGYRYQVAWTNSTRKAHAEGHEPNPEINWYGWIMDFWPNEVNAWHNQC